MIDELEMPLDVRCASHAVEVVRAFLVGEDVSFVTRSKAWDDPAAWGIFAADLLRHVIVSSNIPADAKAAELQRAITAFGLEFNVSFVPGT